MLHAEILRDSIPSSFEQRTSFRLNNPKLNVEVNGRSFNTENWSLNGLLINGIAEDTFVSIPVSGIFGPSNSAEMCRFSGRVVRLDHELNQTAIELDGSSREVAALLPLWVLRYSVR